MGQFPYDKDMTKIAQELRKNLTPEEKRLWYQYLRVYPARFRRQKPFGRYVVDFYCAQAKLAVELDGAPHFTPEGREKDENRTAYLNSLGIRVLRFTDADVQLRFGAVCRMIDAVVKERSAELVGEDEE